MGDYFFSARERTEFYKSYNLTGSRCSKRNFPIRSTTAGHNVDLFS